MLKDNLKPGAKVLDIGSGSGYLTACFADLVGSNGEVTAVELIPEVLQFTHYNIQQGNPELLPNIKFERTLLILCWGMDMELWTQGLVLTFNIMLLDLKMGVSWRRYFRTIKRSENQN